MEKIKIGDFLEEQKAKTNNHNFKNRSYTIECLLVANIVRRAYVY